MMLDIIISFLIATLMGMGIGGGGFLVIYLTLCLNFEQIIAQGTNLVFFIICGLFATLVHTFKRKINPYQLLIMSVLGSLGAFITSHIANVIDPKIPRIALGLLLIVSGALSLIKVFIRKNKNI
ncbi:MAG: sulfite exporter TauE/SafE family protein [Clostridia bacterium]|nr:sulfite exporter TauE/SafE family protein [Clostridia bacterium]